VVGLVSILRIGHYPDLPNPVLLKRGNKVAVKVKPVQPTEIKDKKMVREVIEQIRKPIPASVYKRHEEIGKLIDKMTRK
jgi:hypothetical protein